MKTLLIVEDNADLRESLRDAFEDAGYLVHCAEHGRQGLEVLQQIDGPHAIILDLLMPVMNGNEFYEALRADPEHAGIPVVVTTSDTSRAPDGVPVLKKPFDVDTLLATIASVCAEESSV